MKSSEPKTGAAAPRNSARRTGRTQSGPDGLGNLQAIADASPAVQRLAKLRESGQEERGDEQRGALETSGPARARPAPPPAVAAPVAGVAQRVEVAQLAGLPGTINDMVARVEKGKGNLGTAGKGGQPSYEVDGVTYQGGRSFGNREKKLPQGVSYQEWDVHPLTSGNRGGERLITGSDGSFWYTGDHYSSFTKVK